MTQINTTYRYNDITIYNLSLKFNATLLLNRYQKILRFQNLISIKWLNSENQPTLIPIILCVMGIQ